jgi:Mrp family chromosome partitioning ATPase
VTSSGVLAELYSVKAADRDFRRSGKLPVATLSASPFTESIRELRTAVRVAIGDVAHAVVVVTAADPQAPRAFITANLAASFALSGHRTIAVSGDLRRPQIDELLPPPDGWAGSPHDIRPTRVLNLSMMPVPDEGMDPADYLATEQVRRLIDDLREDATVVVIDAPPVLAAADATILGGYATGVVLVATAGQTDRPVLQEAAERLVSNHVPLLGVAFAGVKGNRRMIYASTYVSDEAAASSRARHRGPSAGQEPVGRIMAEHRGAAQLRTTTPEGDSIADQSDAPWPFPGEQAPSWGDVTPEHEAERGAPVPPERLPEPARSTARADGPRSLDP